LPIVSPNVGARLSMTAREMPDAIAVVTPSRGGRYSTWTFRELDDDSNRIAAGLQAMGVTLGSRLVLLVRPGFNFISLTFALFKAGAVTVLIDPGMGRQSLVRCLAEVEPGGFIAIPLGQAVRTLLRRRFPDARFNVTVGRRWFWGGTTLAALRRHGAEEFAPAAVTEDDPAAIIFTTGSTGPPKGVLYRHGNFCRQVDELRDFYAHPAGRDRSAGLSPVCPLQLRDGSDDGRARHGSDTPRPGPIRGRSSEAIHDWQVTQAFGSPALWNVVGQYCEARRRETAHAAARAFRRGAGAAARAAANERAAIDPAGDVHTPYGATEALPVASISASEVLGQTAARSAQGAARASAGASPASSGR
jgi:olefin beta-lactone synthetase